jgi:hypothetical protein
MREHGVVLWNGIRGLAEPRPGGFRARTTDGRKTLQWPATVGQIDTTIEEAIRRGKTNAALSAIEGQRKARAALVAEPKREAAVKGPANRDGSRTD